MTGKYHSFSVSRQFLLVAQNEKSWLAVASRWAEIVFCLSLLHFGEIDKDDTSEDDTSEV